MRKKSLKNKDSTYCFCEAVQKRCVNVFQAVFALESWFSSIKIQNLRFFSTTNYTKTHSYSKAHNLNLRNTDFKRSTHIGRYPPASAAGGGDGGGDRAAAAAAARTGSCAAAAAAAGAGTTSARSPGWAWPPSRSCWGRGGAGPALEVSGMRHQVRGALTSFFFSAYHVIVIVFF